MGDLRKGTNGTVASSDVGTRLRGSTPTVSAGPKSSACQCPLYPQERTFSEGMHMSALCQKRTSRVDGNTKTRPGHATALGARQLQGTASFATSSSICLINCLSINFRSPRKVINLLPKYSKYKKPRSSVLTFVSISSITKFPTNETRRALNDDDQRVASCLHTLSTAIRSTYLFL